MRLTILNQFYVPDLSPTAHLTASLAEHRVAQGDQVTVVASRGGYVPASSDTHAVHDSDKLRVHRLWTPRLGKARALFRVIDYACFYLAAMLRMLMLPRQDVIVALTTPPFIAWAAVLHKLLHPSTKLVLWNMDCYPEVAERTGVIREGGLPARLMRRLNRALFRWLDHLVCLDTAMVELLLDSYQPANRTLPTTVIPNWEKADFFPSDATPPAWPEVERLQLADRFTVLYLGNTGYGHQFDTVLDAAAKLRNEPVTFLFVGGGSRWNEISRAVHEADLQNVILHGYVPKEQTPAVMAAADCALITLRDFALGVMSPSKLHSNLAMGLPVLYVGPEKSNVDDAIQRFDCGVSVRHGDTDRFVKFIRELMSCPDRTEQLSRRAREAFEQAYCDRQTLPQFQQVLAGLNSN